jgi:hypothetical protein
MMTDGMIEFIDGNGGGLGGAAAEAAPKES